MNLSMCREGNVNWTTISFNNVSNSDLELQENYFSPLFGVCLALPEWEAILTCLALSIIIIITILGNILVILSVIKYPPLNVVSNYFIVSLALADLMVAFAVLPINVAYSLLGRWPFGSRLCKFWLTADVLCCTASILNLCAIAIDRIIITKHR